MILTEEEAKTKWCPFARAFDTVGDEGRPVTVNRDRASAPDKWCLCIASDCMAWRWLSENDRTSASGRGWCGLAGESP